MLARLGRSHFGLISTATPSRDPARDRALPEIECASPTSTSWWSAWRRDRRPKWRCAPRPALAVDRWAARRVVARGSDPGRDAPRARLRSVAWHLSRAARRRGSDATLRVRDASGAERDLSVKRVVGPGERVQLGNLPPLHVVVDTRAVRTPGGRDVGYHRVQCLDGGGQCTRWRRRSIGSGRPPAGHRSARQSRRTAR